MNKTSTAERQDTFLKLELLHIYMDEIYVYTNLYICIYNIESQIKIL